MSVRPPLRFTAQDAEEAFDAWGFSCGPAAVAAICGLTPEEIRPHLGAFELKGYTNPTLMGEILRNLGVEVMEFGRMNWRFEMERIGPSKSRPWPMWGLARIQWEGPWTKEGVPMRVRYRSTHWVGVNSINRDDIGIWDVNALSNGTGWVSLENWEKITVPHILRECHPRANGHWHLTHAIEIGLPA